MYGRLNRKHFFLVILFIGIFSCNTQQKIQSEDIAKEDVPKMSASDNSFDNSITEKYWKLVELNGQKVIVSKNRNKDPHFILKMKDNRVIGHGGCNSFTGTYELQGMNRIRFSKIAASMMACIDTSDMETEVQFFRILESVDNYYVNGDKLQLNRARMATLAQFEAVYFK